MKTYMPRQTNHQQGCTYETWLGQELMELEFCSFELLLLLAKSQLGCRQTERTKATHVMRVHYEAAEMSIAIGHWL